MSKRFIVKLDPDPIDTDRPYYIQDCDYDGLTKLEALAAAAIMEEAGAVLAFYDIEQDFRFKVAVEIDWLKRQWLEANKK